MAVDVEGGATKKPRLTLDAGAMDREMAAETRKAAGLHRPLHGDGMHRQLRDDELIALGYTESAEGSQFDVPDDIVPDGMVYQWIAFEVDGQPHRGRLCQAAERNGWRPVPASRHPGQWTERGYDGPIETGGQRLYELPETEAYNRHRGLYLKGKMQRQDANARLAMAPAGTGPRSHPGIRPQVNVTREQLNIE